MISARTEADTVKLAASLAKKLRAPAVILLRGALGAGKTTFVRGFLRALGHKGTVPSPTFALVNEYRKTNPRIYHMDLYRLEGADASNEALQEYFDDQEAVTLVEWPDAAAKMLPKDRIEIEIEHAPVGRKIKLRAFGSRMKKAIA